MSNRTMPYDDDEVLVALGVLVIVTLSLLVIIWAVLTLLWWLT